MNYLMCMNSLILLYFLNNLLNFWQISDDEEDTHPNIDTPSLFKWRHEARVQRMDEFEKKKKEAKEEKDR